VEINITIYLIFAILGKSSDEKNTEKCGLVPNWGVSEGSKKPNLYFGKVFFQ